MKFLRAVCEMKLGNYNDAITILNDVKRNQWSGKLVKGALHLRMKIYRKQLKYEKSLKDAQTLFIMNSSGNGSLSQVKEVKQKDLKR